MALPPHHGCDEAQADLDIELAPTALLVSEAREHLGARLATYIAGEHDSRTLRRWIEGKLKPSDLKQDRLQLAVEIAKLLEQQNSRRTVQTWLQGSNPMLGGQVPVQGIAGMSTEEDASRVRAAARWRAAR